jgi:hypothetical protein
MPEHRDIPRALDALICFGLPVLVAVATYRIGLIGWLAHTLGDGPGLWALPIILFVAPVPAVLLHELGHAIVARHTVGGRVNITVGDHGQGLKVSFGEVTTTVNVLADPRRAAAGKAEFDGAWATVDDIVLIALAGPLASLLGLAIGVGLLTELPREGVWYGFLWGFTAMSVMGVLNLLPFRVKLDGGPPVVSDGRKVMDALAVKWALR